jgi:hypothetical protein
LLRPNSQNVNGMRVRCPKEDGHFVTDLKDMVVFVAVSFE